MGTWHTRLVIAVSFFFAATGSGAGKRGRRPAQGCDFSPFTVRSADAPNLKWWDNDPMDQMEELSKGRWRHFVFADPRNEDIRSRLRKGEISMEEFLSIVDNRILGLKDDFLPGDTYLGEPWPRGARVQPGVKMKIQFGRPAKPAESRMIGAHSADILHYPEEYRILDWDSLPNGVIRCRFQARLGTDSAGRPEWSKPKNSTLAPKSWSLADIEAATIEVGREKYLVPEETEPDGTTKHRAVFRGVDWVVVRSPERNVTASYPTDVRLRGVLPDRVLTMPDRFRVLSLAKRSDGTARIWYRRFLGEDSDYKRHWSSQRSGTLAPPGGTTKDLEAAARELAKPQYFDMARINEAGDARHLGMYRGFHWAAHLRAGRVMELRTMDAPDEQE